MGDIPSYCTADGSWNVTPINQEDVAVLAGAPAPADLKDLAEAIGNNPKTMCASIVGMRAVTNADGCTGYVADETSRAAGRTAFVAAFIAQQKKNASTVPLAACATLTAIADMESRFSGKSRSRDTMCPAQASNTCTTPGTYCSTGTPVLGSAAIGICDSKKQCRPVQGGFGPLQFDLMWYHGKAFGLSPTTALPVTADTQLQHLFGTNKMLLGPDGKTPVKFPDNLSAFFQSCSATSKSGNHFGEGEFTPAMTECSNQLAAAGVTAPTEEDYRMFEDTACNVHAQCTMASAANRCGKCYTDADCGGTEFGCQKAIYKQPYAKGCSDPDITPSQCPSYGAPLIDQCKPCQKIHCRNGACTNTRCLSPVQGCQWMIPMLPALAPALLTYELACFSGDQTHMAVELLDKEGLAVRDLSKAGNVASIKVVIGGNDGDPYISKKQTPLKVVKVNSDLWVSETTSLGLRTKTCSKVWKLQVSITTASLQISAALGNPGNSTNPSEPAHGDSIVVFASSAVTPDSCTWPWLLQKSSSVSVDGVIPSGLASYLPLATHPGYVVIQTMNRVALEPSTRSVPYYIRLIESTSTFGNWIANDGSDGFEIVVPLVLSGIKASSWVFDLYNTVDGSGSQSWAAAARPNWNTKPPYANYRYYTQLGLLADQPSSLFSYVVLQYQQSQ